MTGLRRQRKGGENKLGQRKSLGEKTARRVE